MDKTLIEKYAEGGPILEKSISGLTKEEMNAHPIAGTWSIQQIVFHMLDSDLIASDRMKRIIAMDKPQLIGYDESAFSEKLFYNELDPAIACDIFSKNRLLTAEILRRLPDSSFQRVGLHNERGELTLEYMVKLYAKHLDNHMKFLIEKRKALGKP